jgi:lipid-binding SYLF domain-containing protein
MLVGLLLSLIASQAAGQDSSKVKKSKEHASNEAREAAQKFEEFMSNSSRSIPRSLLQRAEAVAVFTNVKKGGFIVGGTSGDGVISRRTGASWSPPVYYDMGGADIGLQIGGKQTDYIVVFMTPTALNDLLDDEFELSAAAGVAAGPMGETAAVTTGKESNVYIYSNSGGAFAGATVGGGTIKANNSINEALYKMKAGDALRNAAQIKAEGLPPELGNFSASLAKYSKK